MKFIGDYHLHTYASDGRSSVAKHIEAAKRAGLSSIAICDHSFCSLRYHMTDKKFALQKAEVLKRDGCGVKIYRGIEGNLLGDKLDVPHAVIRDLDILTVGFHRFISPSKIKGSFKFLFVNGFCSKRAKEKLILSNTEAYISVLENYPVDVVAHLGHRAPVDFAKVCECAAKRNVYIELNEKHLDALEEGIDAAIASGVKFIIGTDAHSAKKTGKFLKVREFIEKHGVPVSRIYGTDGNEPSFKDKKEWTYGGDV